MPTTLTTPRAQAATSGVNPNLDEVLRLVGLHGVPRDGAAEVTERDPPEAACARGPRKRERSLQVGPQQVSKASRC